MKKSFPRHVVSGCLLAGLCVLGFHLPIAWAGESKPRPVRSPQLQYTG
jgi:hypothetical protein